MSLALKNNRPVRRKSSGLTQVEADRIEAEFMAAMEPLGERATQYFRGFTLNSKHYFWLLPSYETYQELPIEKQAYVLRYKSYFLSEIAKVELDAIPYEKHELPFELPEEKQS